MIIFIWFIWVIICIVFVVKENNYLKYFSKTYPGLWKWLQGGNIMFLNYGFGTGRFYNHKRDWEITYSNLEKEFEKDDELLNQYIKLKKDPEFKARKSRSVKGLASFIVFAFLWYISF